MTDLITAKSRHLTLAQRIEIQDCLGHGVTFKAIGQRIGKDQTTVSKEVKRHIVVMPSEQKRMDAQGNPLPLPPCPKLLKAPFVCNGCAKRHRCCGCDKQIYMAKPAQEAYQKLLVESRDGVALEQQSFWAADAVISEGIKAGQHLYHILQSNNLGMSKSSVYRHLHKGRLSVAQVDFPRVVKFKARQIRKAQYIPKAAKIGRTYDDFKALCVRDDVGAWVEMDTVIGRIGGKVILTLNFIFCNFQLGLLMDNKSAAETTRVLQALKLRLCDAGLRFGDLFPLILTDNGGEFANVAAIENDLSGAKEASLFFCDPYQSSQKPHCEKNHTLFRDIVPSGSSFDDFSQADVNLIFSHVNGVKRKIFFGKSPYDIFANTLSKTAAAALGISSIPADQVVQSPKLLKF
jgi:IS30 family transposase